MMNIFKKQKDKELESKVEKLENDILELNSELRDLKKFVKQIHDTICVVITAQYEIGNDVGMIYKTLKSLTTVGVEDDLFKLKDDDDKGYLN
jgi:hypothetical protein